MRFESISRFRPGHRRLPRVTGRSSTGAGRPGPAWWPARWP